MRVRIRDNRMVALLVVALLAMGSVLHPAEAKAVPFSEFPKEWTGGIGEIIVQDRPYNPTPATLSFRESNGNIEASLVISDGICRAEYSNIKYEGFDDTAFFQMHPRWTDSSNCKWDKLDGETFVEYRPYIPYCPLRVMLQTSATADDYDTGTSCFTPVGGLPIKNNPNNVPPGQALDSNWWDWPDRDNDGIPDHWEENGVWTPNGFLDLQVEGADPDKADLFIFTTYEEGFRFPNQVYNIVEKAFADSPLNNGSGVNLHSIEGGLPIPENVVRDFNITECGDEVGSPAPVKSPEQRLRDYTGFSDSPFSGGAGVPQLAKFHVNYNRKKLDKDEYGNETKFTTGSACVNGTGLWTSIEDTAKRRSPKLSANEGALNSWRASNFMHEIGHSLGLHHHGASASPNKDYEYHSIMSYAYIKTGLFRTLGRPNRVDFSRSSTVNYDWKFRDSSSPLMGSLTFITGQNGEDPDFYNSNRSAPSGTVESSRSGTLEEQMMAMLPSAYADFADEFGFENDLVFPRVDEPGDWIIEDSDTLTLEAHDLSGQPGEILLIEEPENGSISVDGLTMTYTPNATFSGTETITVRVTNDKLSSEPLEIKIVVGEDTDDEDDDDNTPSPAPGGSLGGSLGSGSLGGS